MQKTVPIDKKLNKIEKQGPRINPANPIIRYILDKKGK